MPWQDGAHPDDLELSRIRGGAMEFAQVGLYRYRLDGTVVFFDRGAFALLGLEGRFEDAEHVIGQNIGTLFQHVDPPGRLRELVETQGSVRDLEYHYRTLDGEERWVYHNAWLVEDPDTGERVVQVISRDITDLKRAARNLEASERRYRTLVEESQQGIAIISVTARRVISVNHALTEILGRPVSTLADLSFDDVMELIHPLDWRVVHERMARRVAGDPVPDRYDLRILRPSGEIRWLTLGTSYVDLDGERLGQVIVLDVTDKHLAEERRRALEERMGQAQRLESLGMLAGGIAHDFNNMLAAVLGHVELALVDPGVGMSAREHVQSIGRAADQAAELCRQLLSYTGRRSLQREPVDLHLLLEETRELLRVSISRNIALELRPAQALPAVEADPSQIRQVLVNLLANASEAIGTRPGTITLTTSVVVLDQESLHAYLLGTDTAPGRFVEVEVADDGPGIGADAVGRIFDPFFSTKSAGRGLGLAAVLGIVRGHGGAVRVDSAPGRGTVIKVVLPAAEDPPRSETPAPAQAQWRSSARVLVADDQPEVRQTLTLMLEHLGMEVVAVADGQEAVRRFAMARVPFDLVLLDLTMPRMGGAEALERIRARRPDVPVLLASGFDLHDASPELLDLPRVGSVQKPVRLPDLVARLRALLD